MADRNYDKNYQTNATSFFEKSPFNSPRVSRRATPFNSLKISPESELLTSQSSSFINYDSPNTSSKPIYFQESNQQSLIPPKSSRYQTSQRFPPDTRPQSSRYQTSQRFPPDALPKSSKYPPSRQISSDIPPKSPRYSTLKDETTTWASPRFNNKSDLLKIQEIKDLEILNDLENMIVQDMNKNMASTKEYNMQEKINQLKRDYPFLTRISKSDDLKNLNNLDDLRKLKNKKTSQIARKFYEAKFHKNASIVPSLNKEERPNPTDHYAKFKELGSEIYYVSGFFKGEKRHKMIASSFNKIFSKFPKKKIKQDISYDDVDDVNNRIHCLSMDKLNAMIERIQK